jgi:hypothetical protein
MPAVTHCTKNTLIRPAILGIYVGITLTELEISLGILDWLPWGPVSARAHALRGDAPSHNETRLVGTLTGVRWFAVFPMATGRTAFQLAVCRAEKTIPARRDPITGSGRWWKFGFGSPHHHSGPWSEVSGFSSGVAAGLALCQGATRLLSLNKPDAASPSDFDFAVLTD